VTALGYIAGLMTSLSFLPQVVRSYRTGSAASFSWGWLLLFAAGVAAWTCYGALRGDAAIIVANAVTFSFVLVLIGLRSRDAYRTRRREF
jgi:MtN3 and saliva related transmembrane protein